MPCKLLAAAVLLFAGIFAIAGCGTGTTHLTRGDTDANVAASATGRAPFEIVAVTLNVHDLYVAGKDRKRRMELVGRTLAELDPDVVGIQEAFIESDREILLAQLEGSRLVNHAYFGQGKTGSGLLILSAFPILETDFHEYVNRGKWFKIWQGDYWAGKGVALTRVSLGGGAVLEFYNTHAQASYVADGKPDANAPVRLRQMEEMRDFVLRTSRPGNPAILAGDTNCTVGMEDYETLVEGAGLDRLLTVPTEWDHVFAMRKPGWSYRATPTRLLTTATTAEGQEIRLSDHDGYLTTITITREESNP